MKLPKGYDGYNWLMNSDNEHELYGMARTMFGFDRRLLGRVVQGRHGFGWKQNFVMCSVSEETLREIIKKIEELKRQ